MRFRVLYQTRSLVNHPAQGNLPGEAYVKVGFRPVVHPTGHPDAGYPICVEAETPEAAFATARDYLHIPRGLLAVEPF